MHPIDELGQLAHQLTEDQLQSLLRMARALAGQVQVWIHEQSDFLSHPEIVDTFSDRLRMHHATQRENFGKKSFEYLFVDAARAAGFESDIFPSGTNRGADIRIDGIRISLKTEGSASIREEQITISKLMEGRYIQECQSLEQLVSETLPHVLSHFTNYDRIFTLRAFDHQNYQVRYDLVEINKALLMRIANLTLSNFGPLTEKKGSRADIFDDAGRAFALVLDGSDGKVRITNLRSDLCLRHGTWIVPTV